MFLEQAQSSADHFGFIIVTPTGNEPIYQAFEMGRYDFAHSVNTFQQFQPVVNIDSLNLRPYFAQTDDK